MPDNEEKEEVKNGENSGQENSEETTDSSEESAKKPFENLDLNVWRCFGIEHPVDKSWVSLCIRSRTLGWKKTNLEDLQLSLKTNVNESYLRIATFFLTDLDDDMKYTCFFDNMKCMWGVQIQDSPKAEMELEQKANFFKSDMFKKIACRSADIITQAVSEYNEVVDQHLRNGELLDIDEVKLAAILQLANQKFTMDNLRNGKWMK